MGSRNPGRCTHAGAACPSCFGASQHASGNAGERAGRHRESVHEAFSGQRLRGTHCGDRTEHQFDGIAASGHRSFNRGSRADQCRVRNSRICGDANRQCGARNRSGAGAKEGNQETPLCMALRVAQRTTASAGASITIELTAIDAGAITKKNRVCSSKPKAHRQAGMVIGNR